MAVIKYYNNIDGIYTEHPDGILLGIEWLDGNANGVRAILFLLDLSTLQGGQEVTFIYQVELKPAGTEGWLIRDRPFFKLRHDVMTLQVNNLARAFHPTQPIVEDPPPPEAVAQLDLFVGLYLTGKITPQGNKLPPMYNWLAEIMAELEGQEVDGEVTHVFLPETLAIIALLTSQGIILTLAQKIALDNVVRGLPAGAPAENENGGLHPAVVEFLLSENMIS